MRVLLLAGLLYLTGIAIVLFLRPRLMFTDSGVWKEFGIGRDTNYYTWFPIWLFCILWAFFCYFVVILFSPENAWTMDSVEVVPPPAISRGRRNKYIEKVKPGYYMLNTEGSGIEGVPKYIYLGTDAPPGQT
jgi:hypothetical protein